MPAVLVHGVPDIFRVWEPLRKHLSRQDVVALALPGFNSPLPANFNATKEEYANWIIRQLEDVGEPVDLVGHDWGCMLTMRVASLRPDLIRSWAVGSGPVSATYEWHPLAKIWQTPGEGEEWFKVFDPSAVANFMAKAGLPMESAEEAVSHIDQAMGIAFSVFTAQLWKLESNGNRTSERYRHQASSFGVKEDTTCPVEFANELASDTKARRVLKLNAGHWTIVERSTEVAQALEHHWASVDETAKQAKGEQQ